MNLVPFATHGHQFQDALRSPVVVGAYAAAALAAASEPEQRFQTEVPKPF